MNKKGLHLNGLYAILDESLISGSDRDWLRAADSLLKSSARIIQLRAKTMGAGRMLDIARKLRKACEKSGALFVVNDRTDVARAAGTAVHLGQDDLPIEAARHFLGKGSIIGISTHSLKQAENAVRAGADYIAFGPIFTTSTKPDALKARGLARLKQVVKTVNVPVVAIGGIGVANIAQVRYAGANAAAIISALGTNGKLEENARRLIEAWAGVEKLK